MGGHHKKNLRAEKAKVKLKGAKLPKGLNVTKTEFKVRKITIREQLKEVSTGDGGVRHVNLKETLTRLKHHGSNFRLEAMRNLRDAIANNHPGIVGQLTDVMQGVAAGCLDVEREPRRESFKTLASVLSALPVATIGPFFHIISSYLRCAMTHIQPQLQEDALLMLDVLLQHVPMLVAQHSDRIFHHFLEMISRASAEGNSGGRMLNVNMGQKQTTIKWRSKVLQRLQRMLQTLVENGNKSGMRVNNTTMPYSRTFNFNSKELQYFTLKRTWNAQQTCDLNSIFCSGMGKRDSESAEHLQDNGEVVRGYVEHLLPLLMDAWLEVRPQEESRMNTQMVLSAEAADCLQVVLEIIENLWTLVRQHEADLHTRDLSRGIRDGFADVFANNFMQTASFPYQQAEQIATERRGKVKMLPKSETLCFTQNLSLVYIMSEFFANQFHQQGSTKLCELLDYLNVVLRDHCRQLSAEHFRLLEKCLRAYLIDNAPTLLKINNERMRLLLRSTINALLHNQFNKADGGGISARVLVLLGEIVRTRHLLESYGLDELKDFLEFLPQLLLRSSISESSLIAMSSLGKQKNECFLRALAKHSTAILQNLQQIQVLGAFNAFEGKKQIINLFFWLDKSWLPNMEQLVGIIQEYVTDKRMLVYSQFILSHS